MLEYLFWKTFSAVPCPLQALLCVRFLGLDRLTMAIGNASLLKGIAAAIGPIVAGIYIFASLVPNPR